MDLALISEQLGAAAVVEQLASYDHDQALIAVADYLEGLDLEALRGHRIRTKVLEAAVEGLGPDDIVDGTLELRRTKIAQAKNRLRAIALATEREVGQRLAELEPDRGGHPSDGNDRRAAKTIFGLNKHQTSLLIRLAALDEDAFSRAVAQAQASKGDVSIATIVRFGSADADWTMDESSTPPHVVNLCREVGGKAFDMDGASHLAAQVAHVRAIRWCGKGTPKMGRRERAWQRRFDLTDGHFDDLGFKRFAGDGLDRSVPWGDWAFLNMPYSAELARAFHERLRAELERPLFGAMVVLNMDPSKDDQQDLGARGLHMQPRSRWSFLGHDGAPMKGNRYSQVVFGVGNISPTRFRDRMSALGQVYTPAEPRIAIAHVQELAVQHQGTFGKARTQALFDELGALREIAG